MVENIGTTNYPSSNVAIRSIGTVAVSAAFDNTVGIVAGMDTDNGSATAGEVTKVQPSNAEGLFGEDAEMTKQVQLAALNDAATIYACPPTETSTTESVSSSGSGTLSDYPLDPNVHEEHDITAQDTTEGASVDVSIVYDSPPSTPSGSNEMNVNPRTKEWDADASSDYDITYTHADYKSAIENVAAKIPRFIGLSREVKANIDTLETELTTYGDGFDFMHGVAGAPPELDVGGYTNPYDERRIVLVAPARAYQDEAETDMVRTAPAIASMQASYPFGESTTRDRVSGFTALHTSHQDKLQTLIDDKNVLPLMKDGGIEVAKDVNTSTDARLGRIYVSEIADEVAQISNTASSDFVGEKATDSNMSSLGESVDTPLGDMQDDNILDNYSVEVSQGATDNEFDLDISISPVDMMDIINVDIAVADTVEFGGAS